MNPLFPVTASALSLALVALPVRAAQAPVAPQVSASNDAGSGAAMQQDPAGRIGYADIADLVLSAPIIADATVRSTSKIKAAEAPNLAPGLVRLYVEVDVTALVRGADGLPPRIGYLLDVMPDSAGHVPKFKKARVLIFARPVAGAVNQVQLVAPDAQLDWTPASDARARRIAKDALASDAPPVITGVGNAFHVAGALPGEGETQIFLTTADQRPVSLSILRRPGEQPRWAVALSEIVDESAAPPAPETLLWYRMACALPPTLPERSTTSLEAADATIAREDYAFVLAALGPCGRTRKI
ncbi:hypothetical protein C8J46_10273 [Sphingomonas sp. PP-F2F-A104-K0414]|uniref:hypothetical protein n=1 Tax=Sphingomonas sp. PP-F2F-A104-K0414 TaxID=2135661 RepID=UPI001045DA15|nr:hypothetical protein [Sphingomonas sp. PP-F2F-A104-K0414]TCP99935.1 hypothetical protein C8J46_10273 [Sphingomonas sp. PP-F2F-A104-K0414]